MSQFYFAFLIGVNQRVIEEQVITDRREQSSIFKRLMFSLIVAVLVASFILLFYLLFTTPNIGSLFRHYSPHTGM